MPQQSATLTLTEGSTAVVTGGLGFVGSHLVRALAARGVEVTVFDLAEPRTQLPYGVQHRLVDLREPKAIRLALPAADAVFHLAGNASGTVSVDDPRFDFQSNTEATFNLCEALIGSAVRCFTYLSSAMVYGRPQTCPISELHPTQPFLPYAASKLSGEHIVRSMYESFGLPAVIARAFTIYGPGEDPRRAGGEVSQFLRWHLNGRPIPAVGDPDRKTRDFMHVVDLVSALITVSERGGVGSVYNLGSGTETSLRELAEAITRATGRPAELVSDDTVLEDSYRHVADVARLHSLGHRSRVPLLHGVADLARRLGDNPELPTTSAVFRRPVAASRAPVVAVPA